MGIVFNKRDGVGMGTTRPVAIPMCRGPHNVYVRFYKLVELKVKGFFFKPFHLYWEFFIYFMYTMLHLHL